MTDIPMAIRVRMAQLGVKQGEISKRAGIPQSSLSNIAKGGNPTILIINKIAAAMDITVSELCKLGE